MGKRFGRNQRRKMREQIVKLQDSNESGRNSLVRVMRERDTLSHRLNDWAEDVVHLMGRDSAFNERIWSIEYDTQASFVNLPRPGRVIDIRPQDGGMPMLATAETVIRALIWRLNISHDEFSHLVRVELLNRESETTAYALSEKHVWTERDIEVVSRMVARELVRYKQSRR